MRRLTPLFPLIAILFVPLPLAGQPRPEPSRPIGTWERVVSKGTITLRFEADRLCISGTERPSGEVTTIDAEYSVTKDSVIYGIVFGTTSEDSAANDKLLDLPFSFRFRIYENVLTIKGVKGFGDDVANKMVGRYNRAGNENGPPSAKAPPAPAADGIKSYYSTPVTTGTAKPERPAVGIKETRSKD